ncbi:MAG: alanine racemase [Burkholderiaceae bacterium]
MARPLRALIDVSSMRNNLLFFRKQLGSVRCWAVVKANAYGHGFEAALQALGQADGLALIEPDLALELRDRGWRKPILLMEGVFEEADVLACVEAGIDMVVHSAWQLELVESGRYASSLRERGPRLWVKFNSGMNRLGFSVAEGLRHLKRLRHAGFRLGAIAHFANADALEADVQSEQAMVGLLRAVKALDQEIPCSFSNSAASQRLLPTRGGRVSIQRPDLPEPLGADWLRLGIALYGGSAFDGTKACDLGLAPVMRLETRVLAIQSLEPGDRVGYGGRFVAERPSRIAVLAGGYADGYPRQAPDGTPVWIAGHLCPLAGRVSMDMLSVDVTDYPDVGVGAPAQLWGDSLPVDQVAAAAGTIGYQLLSGLTARVPRVLINQVHEEGV